MKEAIFREGKNSAWEMIAGGGRILDSGHIFGLIGAVRMRERDSE